MKLTDAQRVILTTAAQRSDGKLLPLPKSIRFNKAAATTVLKSLLKHGLAADAPAAAAEDAWREAKDGQRRTLVITRAGFTAVGADPGQRGKQDAAAAMKDDKQSRKEVRPIGGKSTSATKNNHGPRPGTKLALLIDLLKRKNGATVDEVAKATRWQTHSVRGAMSGALKKKLGLTITSSEEARGRVYRVSAR